MAINQPVERRNLDKRLFLAVAIVFPLVVLAGFARTYYLKTFFHTPPLSSWMVHLHGLLMTTWVVLFISQVRLISLRRIRTHQRFGFAAIGLALLMIFVGFLIAVHAAKFGASTPSPPGIPRLAFLLVPLTDLFNFVILFSAAILLRKRPADHKRLMLLTVANFLPAAVARIRIPSLQALGPLWFFGFPTVLVLIALIIDWRGNKKMNKVFLGGTLFLISTFVLRLAIMGTPAWMRFAAWLTSWAA
jgi:hypothetical protein